MKEESIITGVLILNLDKIVCVYLFNYNMVHCGIFPAQTHIKIMFVGESVSTATLKRLCEINLV